MADPCDVIVLGLGAMGSSAAYHLARRGLRVLGLDRFRPPHAWGSSHGETRIIREAYFEDPRYVPFVQRAYTLWDELQAEVGQPLWRRTGGLMIGPPDGLLVTGALRSAEVHRLPHDLLSAAQVRERFPALSPPPRLVAVYEPRAGALFPETCIAACLAGAARAGATLRTDEPALRWRADGAGVTVRTELGDYRAGSLVLSAGPWLRELVPDLSLPLTVTRQVLHWFEPLDGSLGPDQCPIWIAEHAPQQFVYGFPDFGAGVKMAEHALGEATAPDAVRREVAESEAAAAHALLARFAPPAAGAWQRSSVCLYTNTPDGHFLIDRHPALPQVVLASPCSGHGLKFASAIGEALADLATGATPQVELDRFRWRW